MGKMSLQPEKLRPELHQRIDAMEPQQLELLHRVLLRLELDQVVEQLNDDFDRARGEGKLDKAEEIIRQVRARRPYA
jgi:hypothetical protein